MPESMNGHAPANTAKKRSDHSATATAVTTTNPKPRRTRKPARDRAVPAVTNRAEPAAIGLAMTPAPARSVAVCMCPLPSVNLNTV